MGINKMYFNVQLLVNLFISSSIAIFNEMANLWVFTHVACGVFLIIIYNRATQWIVKIIHYADLYFGRLHITLLFHHISCIFSSIQCWKKRTEWHHSPVSKMARALYPQSASCSALKDRSQNVMVCHSKHHLAYSLFPFFPSVLSFTSFQGRSLTVWLISSD